MYGGAPPLPRQACGRGAGGGGVEQDTGQSRAISRAISGSSRAVSAEVYVEQDPADDRA
eukprot:CAMPEP_0185436264 /NCGR_PEP_ID=MMETSP1365-20130426/27379_1 /TAXON_ID=38817 /ORGANISM="Gephyrocapsa oceanica, Strain RCC1303" /LENGTH=58 /DNA_ID=CAMNT_0028041039 /DNA_START=192 /DNA_END=364 /DNA_ORIENTATION=-